MEQHQEQICFVSSKENLRLVCAVIDVQGLCLQDEFIPIALSVTNGSRKQTIIFDDSEIPMRFYTSGSVSYHSKYIHGYTSSNAKRRGEIVLSTKRLKQFLKSITKVYATPEKHLLAVANNQLATLLAKYKVPHLDLTKGEVCPPSHKKLAAKYGTSGTFCSNHIVPDGSKLNCAERKVNDLWRWLVETEHLFTLFRDLEI